MEFSLDWVRRYVDLPEDVETIARRLTEVGLAAEGERAVGDDVVLDLDVTTNRPDCMNHLGVARELATAFDRELRAPEAVLPASDGEPPVRVDILDPSLCRRYVGLVVRGVTVGPSPDWLVRSLEAIGSRPINNVVDVTNFVLWEVGQPLHAFDLDTLAERRIEVRLAREGETVRTLDGEDRDLTPEMLVIADAERPVALAGVMGGEATEVTESTVDVLVECAWFDQSSVRTTARALGLHTDASHRFERGADLDGCLAAAVRTAELIVEVAGGSIEGPPTDARGDALPPLPSIHLSSDRLDRFVGVSIDRGDTERWLRALGFELRAVEGGFDVVPPPWRRFDVLEAADVMEEVLRHFGFDRVPATVPQLAGIDAPEPAGHRLREQLKDLLFGTGYAEAINFGFIAESEDSGFVALEPGERPVALDNPISERYAVMRRSLVPGLVESARFNRRRNRPDVRLFELGHAFWVGADGKPAESGRLAIVAGGTVGLPWYRTASLDFFDLKGVVEAVADQFGAELTIRAADLVGFEPGRSAEWLDLRGRRVGVIGEVTEDDAGYPLFAAELETAALLPFPGPSVADVPSRFPGVSVDATLTHSLDVAWVAIEGMIRDARPPDLVDFALKDRYRGEGVPEGAVNTTVTFTYNAGDRSMTQDEVNERHSSITAMLESSFGIGGDDG